jgi:hypothetical protein
VLYTLLLLYIFIFKLFISIIGFISIVEIVDDSWDIEVEDSTELEVGLGNI